MRPVTAASLAELAERGGVPGPRGFLPTYEPLRQLPAGFEPWDEVAAELPVRHLVGRLRSDLEALPILEPSSLADGPEVERAMLLLGLFAGAFVHATDPPESRIPAPVASPLLTLSRRLDRPPIIAHASLAMHNWRRLDPAGPLEPENLAKLEGMHGSSDETWFITIAVAIEACGGHIPALVVRAAAAAKEGDAERVTTELVRLEETVRQVTVLTDRTREGCDPHIFYNRVRPQFSGWLPPGVTYEGTGAEPMVLAGGSAAQSPLVQTLDAALSIAHPEAARGPLLEMRRYMRPEHRRFVTAVEQDGSIRRLASSGASAELTEAYDASVAALVELRRVHMAIVNDYIVRQAQPGATARGTGGTDFGRFLGGTLSGVERSKLSD